MKKPTSKIRPWGAKKVATRPMQERTRSSAFYHTSRWTKESRRYREEHPICVDCTLEGMIIPSEVVDHITPLELCADPWDRNNWQALCKRHNNSKAARDKQLIAKHKNER